VRRSPGAARLPLSRPLVVDAPIERVYDAIGDVPGYEFWWTDFVIRATGDESPPKPGNRNELVVKAYLPYKVNFGLEVVEAERPQRILSRLSKDFDGTGEWTLEERHATTVATLDWRPAVNHPLIRYLTPALRPLFRSNHNWRCGTGSGRSASTSPRRSSAQPNPPACRFPLNDLRRRQRQPGCGSGKPASANEEWARLGSNQRPLACEASALPLSYAPLRRGLYVVSPRPQRRRDSARAAPPPVRPRTSPRR
jgi:uncharacterized protein YndB with AHSA1/START domain